MRPPRTGATPGRRRLRSDSRAGSVSAATAARAHTFDLFSIRKLLSVSRIPRAEYEDTTGSAQVTATPDAMPPLVEPPKNDTPADGDDNPGTAASVRTEATIDVVAFGGYDGHSYAALSCSVGSIIVRHVGASAVPLVRIVPWKKDPYKSVKAMAFDPEATWLMIVTQDASLYLLPVHALMCHQLNERNDPFYSHSVELSTWTPNIPSLMGFASTKRATDYFGPLTDVTEYTNLVQPGVGMSVTSCVWWKPWDGPDCALVASLEGTISILNLQSRELIRTITLAYPISNLELIIDDRRSYKYCLIHTRGGTWRLLLEQEVDYKTYQTILSHSGLPEFQTECLTRLPPGAEVSLQRTKQGAVVGVYNTESAKFEVFDGELNKFPLFVYQLFRGVDYVHLTDKFLFTVTQDTVGGRGRTSSAAFDPSDSPTRSHDPSDMSLFVKGAEERNRVSVVSNLIAGTSATPYANIDATPECVVQDFLLPAGQNVCGVARYAPSAPLQSDPIQTESPESSNTQPGFEGCYFWTSDTLYELRAKTDPESIFKGLIASHQDSEAEVLGKTCALDLFQLYEEAADAAYAQGAYARSLRLYALSNVSALKLVRRFVDTGQMHTVIEQLSELLEQPASLPLATRRSLSDILFQSYLHACLSQGDDNMIPSTVSVSRGDGVKPVSQPSTRGDLATEGSEADRDTAPSTSTSPARQRLATLTGDFLAFLSNNEYYDSGKCLMSAIYSGMVNLALRVAVARSMVPRCLNILAQHGLLHLSPAGIAFLQEQGYGDVFCGAGEGALLRRLSPHDRLKALIYSPAIACAHWRRLELLADLLDEQDTLELARFLDPVRTDYAFVMRHATDVLRERATQGRDRSRDADSSGTGSGPPPLSSSGGGADGGDQISPDSLVPSCHEEVLELFLTSVIRLNALRDQSESSGDSERPLYSRDDLRTALHRHAQGYRPPIALHAAMAFKDHETAATVLALSGQWAHCLHHRLEAASKQFSATSDKNAATEAVTDALTETTALCNSPQELAELVLQVLRFWASLELPWPRLETYLLRRLDTLGAALVLCLVVRGFHAPGGDEDAPASLPFSPEFYVAITDRHISDLHGNGQGNASGRPGPQSSTSTASLAGVDDAGTTPKMSATSTVPRVSVSRLWTELSGNLDKDVDKRMFVQVPVTVLRSGDSSSGSTLSDTGIAGSQNFIAFTCGHHFSKKAFFDNILPAFQKRLENLSTSTPLTDRLFMADYKLKVSRLACPICLYNSLRQSATTGRLSNAQQPGAGSGVSRTASGSVGMQSGQHSSRGSLSSSQNPRQGGDGNAAAWRM